MKNALKEQVGGSHYKDSPIQPVEYSHANKLGFIEGSVVKYVSRHRQKNGRQDIEKAIHFLKILLDLEYPNEVSQSSTTDYLGVKEVPIETKGNGLLDGVKMPIQGTELSGVISSSGSIVAATVDPKVFYHQQSTK